MEITNSALDISTGTYFVQVDYQIFSFDISTRTLQSNLTLSQYPEEVPPLLLFSLTLSIVFLSFNGSFISIRNEKSFSAFSWLVGISLVKLIPTAATSPQFARSMKTSDSLKTLQPTTRTLADILSISFLETARTLSTSLTFPTTPHK